LVLGQKKGETPRTTFVMVSPAVSINTGRQPGEDTHGGCRLRLDDCPPLARGLLPNAYQSTRPRRSCQL